MMVKLILKQGEAKTIRMTVKDGSGVPVDLSGATLLLGVKKGKSEAAYALSKGDADFDKSRASEGIVSVHLTAEDTDLEEATYIGELRCAWPGPPEVVDKSADFFIQIRQAVTT
jgi:hypothetical protein